MASKFITKQDIVREYSDTVMGMLATGWTIFTPTMGGSQGEDAHVDVISRDHKVVYRVLLYRESDWRDGADHKYVITVRGYVPEDVNCQEETWDSLYKGGYCTIWNDKGVEVNKRVFYAMPQGDTHYDYHYTTDASVPTQAKERREYKWKNNLYEGTLSYGNPIFPVKVDKKALVKFVRTVGGRGYGNCRREDIAEVHKYRKDEHMRYVVQFHGTKKSLSFG